VSTDSDNIDATYASLRSEGERVVSLGRRLGVENVALNLFTLNGSNKPCIFLAIGATVGGDA
jgi:hypothetical protein